MKIILIAAMAANRVIGRDNGIPWHIPDDQQRFKKITMGHTLIMGRKTFESIGRPLPGRMNIVITRQKDYPASGCVVTENLKQALKIAANGQRVFIAGGGQIYKEALPLADEIHLTTLKKPVAGDVFFPNFSAEEFSEEYHETVYGPEPYTVSVFRRKKAPDQALSRGSDACT